MFKVVQKKVREIIKGYDSGFTMIELLVVIAVIGILAVALLATLNPLEQIRKGRDTRTRTDVAQLDSAIERYNASLGYFPWQSTESENLDVGVADVNFLQINAAVDLPVGCTLAVCTVAGMLATLTDTSEVKSGFIDRIVSVTYNDIFLYFNDESTGSSVIGCFTPESTTFSREAFDRCQADSYGSDFLPVYAPGLVCPDGADATAYGALAFDPTSANEMICLP